jgi:DNA-binding NtrC family response regulator
MAAHILQVAYYDTLQEVRAKMLEAAGYQVTSVLGNDQAMELNRAVIAATDLVLVGFSAPHSVRAELVHWFKARYPNIPVAALQFYEWEKFPEADVATSSEDPAIWLAEIASMLKP